jgi:hypothetical protein
MTSRTAVQTDHDKPVSEWAANATTHKVPWRGVEGKEIQHNFKHSTSKTQRKHSLIRKLVERTLGKLEGKVYCYTYSILGTCGWPFETHRTDGATMTPIRISLVTTRGWDGGISNICFKKKVFSSETCQKMTIWHSAKNRIYVHVGSSQRTCVQLPGVNCSTARFILPDVEWMSLWSC